MVSATPMMKRGIRARILVILVLMAGSYIVLVAMVQFTAGATHQHMDRVSSVVFPAAFQLQKAEASFEQLKKRYKEAVLLEDPAGLADADKDGDGVATALEDLSTTVAKLPDLAGRANDVSAQFLSIRARSRETYGALVGSNDNVTNDVQARVAALAADNETLTATMQELDRSLGDQGREEFHATEVWSGRSRIAGWTMLMLGLAGCAGAWWVLQYKVILPLHGLARRMRDIAEGNGDLTGRVEVHGHNELDEVGGWFNIFIERIEQIVVRVNQNACDLGEAATGLAGIAHETATHSAMQQDQAAHITTSMGAISTAVRQISETTQSAARDASRAEQNAHSGGQTIQSTVAMIQQLLVANQATATKVEELGHASDAIGRIVEVIDDIANQTSLLALNASIESARAGEHGRGFAVVAAEVRRLADRTGGATSEINETVRAMQDGTAEVVEAMRASMKLVEIGVGSAQSAGDALASIIQGSEAVQSMVMQIACASTQQSHATQSVNASLTEISSIIERTNSSSAHAVDACQRLSNLAGDLNALVGSFRVRKATENGRRGTDGRLVDPPGTQGRSGTSAPSAILCARTAEMGL